MAFEFEVLYGDILGLDVESIVVPEIATTTVKCEFTARVFDEAGYIDMTEACGDPLFKKGMHFPEIPGGVDIREYMESGEYSEAFNKTELHSDIYVTPGFRLNAESVIHLRIFEENWQDSQLDCERYHKECSIQNCYIDVLDVAKEHEIRSIAFPVLGTCFLGFPEDFARLIAENTISSWCRDNSEEDLDMNVYLVVPHAKRKPIPKPVKAELPDNYYDRIFTEYEKELNKRIEEAGLGREEFYRSRCLEYLNRIDSSAKLCRLLGFGSDVITRFINAVSGQGTGNKPKKIRVIALSIGMGLSDYERYEFVRCSGYDYPYEPLDDQVEAIIRSGITSFKLINKKLCEINPDFDLSAPLRKEAKKPTRQETR